MDKLLVRFPRPQRVFIRQKAKKLKISEAAFIRMSIEFFRQEYEKAAKVV